MKKILTINLIFLLIIVSDCFAYLTDGVMSDLDAIYLSKGAGTHNSITSYAIANLTYEEGVRDRLIANKASILEGDFQEDEEKNSNALHHFFDPILYVTPDWGVRAGLFGLVENANDRAVNYYKQAQESYRLNVNKSDAWNKIGRALHLLQDMAVPAHVHTASHWQHATSWRNGYEWWVARNWEPLSNVAQGFYLKPYLDTLIAGNPYFRKPIPAGDMNGYMEAMAIQTYYGYLWDKAPIAYSPGFINYPTAFSLAISAGIVSIVNGAEAEHQARFLVPAAVQVGGGLLQRFCKDVACASDVTQPDKKHVAGSPDDNFDVSSRMIKLEEMDPTKELWKDIYSRTGITKGNLNFYLSKCFFESYSKVMAATTDEEHSAATIQIQNIINQSNENIRNSYMDAFITSPDVAILSQGYSDEAANILLKRLKEPIREVSEMVNPTIVQNQPVFIIPSAGIYGFDNSSFLKSSLDEYVKNGGTLIVFTQQHGYEFGILPTPDGKSITGYGWTEDQNCFTDGTYIDTWHQMLSGQNRSTPTVNVDGYFTSYPPNSTILLRRTANGQPAMIMYDYGQGRVIATTMYSDWAYGHGQTSAEEIKLIRDMISWAKKPDLLPEIKPGETASFHMSVLNSSATPAASIKLQFYNPDRSSLLFEQSTALALPPGETASIPVSYDAATSSSLGIHHVDYLLYDSLGNLIQPQAETDSGRFVISTPPRTGTINRSMWFSISTNSQSVFFGSPFEYTFHIFNNTNDTRNLTIKTLLPHTNRTHEWSVTAAPNEETRISDSDLFIDSHWMFETLRAYLYDENGTEIGSYMLSFQGTDPSLNVAANMDKPSYKRGEMATAALTLQNKEGLSVAAAIKLRVTDPSNTSIYDTSSNVTIGSNEETVQNVSFPLPVTAQGGTYAVLAEAFDASGKKIGGTSASFDVLRSQIAVSLTSVATYSEGPNPITFRLSNIGKIDVNSGHIDVNLIDPDGRILSSESRQFSLPIGQTADEIVTVTIPAIKFGTYTLIFSEGDETKTGKATLLPLRNSAAVTTSLDKVSYRIRESVNLTVSLSNTGLFNLNGIAMTVSVPDAAYSSTQTVSLNQSCQFASCKVDVPVSFVLPQTIASGQSTATITVALPSGSTLVQTAAIPIPGSSVSTVLDQTAYAAGGTITTQLVNSGGVDAPIQYRLSLYDSRSALIAEKSSLENVEAGSSLPVSLSIPAGAADGGYNFVISYQDTKAGKAEIINKPFTIAGVKGTLRVRTDKQFYLTTENITSLSTITNTGTSIVNGNLHLQVTTAAGSQKTKTWSSQYDFQQGVRNGVDTFGVNDWLVPADDFEAASLDLNRWSEQGNVSILSGKLLVDCSSSQSSVLSRYRLEGNFDIQVDFSENKSQQSEGAELGISWDNYYAFIKNTGTEGYLTDMYNGSQLLGGSRTGGYKFASSGTFRIVRNSKTVITYYLENGNWIELYRYTFPTTTPALVQMYVWRGQNYPATAEFDNVKINSGRVFITNETVDSVRLLPSGDSFDNGSINTDRWVPAGNVAIQSGKITIDSSTEESSLTGSWQFMGDFDTQVDFSSNNSVGNEGAQFDVSNGPVLVFIKNTQQEGYFSGIWINGVYIGWSQAGQYADSGRLRIARTGDSVSTYYWSGTSWVKLYGGTYPELSQTLSPRLFVWRGAGLAGPSAAFDNFSVSSGGKYLPAGTVSLKHDAGQPSEWQSLAWNSSLPIGTSIQFRTRTADTEAGLSVAPWSDSITISGTPITSPKGRWIEVEAILATTDSSVTPLLHDIIVTYGNKPGDIIWQADIPVNLANLVSNLTASVGNLTSPGKLYLQGTLASSTGQAIASSEYPFYVAQGNTVLIMGTDNKIYRPGETVTVSGMVKNLASVDATGLSLDIKQAQQGMAGENFYAESLSAIPAGESHAFTVTTTAQTVGIVNLVGSVTQNSAFLAEVPDQYEVSSPVVAATVTAPDAVGNENFPITIELKNTGKVEASVQFMVQGSGLTDAKMLAIPAGESILVQYFQKISGSTSYNFTFAGDLNQTITKTVAYDLAADVRIETQKNVCAEGVVAIPVTITNTGRFDAIFAISYRLQNANMALISEQTKSYFIPKGGYTSDNLSYSVAEGSYHITVESREPWLITQATLTVVQENNIRLDASIGSQENDVIPVAVSLSNLGSRVFDGTVAVSFLDKLGAVAWNGEQQVQGIIYGSTSVPVFHLDSATVQPGEYLLSVKAFNSSGADVASQTLPFSVQAANILVTQIPPYQTFMPGQDGTFLFKVKNTGNQEGQAKLLFRAYDLLNASRSIWLKAGEEQEVAFSFPLPADLDEKDYDAGYELQGQAAPLKGTVKYHLAGINVTVSASLDRNYYSIGDVAHLTLTVAQQAQANSQDYFARVNYAGYEQKVFFSLNGSKTLSFDIPLAEITGEKLFYGIYHSGGRSIHLNAIYIYKAGDGITLVSDKQVYNPGETVFVSIVSGQPGLSGQMTLTGPGGFSETLDFSGSASRGIALPATMTAGTQPINAQLKTQNSVLTATLPIDVNGIQIKIAEAKTDKGKYSPTDTIQLALTISSNREMPAMLRTWVVDPKGTYTAAGESLISLTSSDPVLASQASQLATGISGIHRLVYGIYAGDMLLSSGSEAFDVGDAVLLGLSTDKRSYPTVTEQVIAQVTLQGNSSVHLEFLVDGTIIRAEESGVSGLTTASYVLPGIMPGSHVLKVVMHTGSLSSTLETEFSLGATLPDLTAALTSGGVVNDDGTITVTAYIRNEGKTISVPTTITLFEGDAPLDSQAVPALSGREETTLAFSWIAAGKTGDHLLKTVVDPENAVEEFTKMNNTAITYIRIPDDAVPPVTTISFGIPNVITNGVRYITPDTMITLSAADNYAGVSDTEFRVDGGAWTSYAPFTIATEGAHTIAYRSKDSAGNMEAPNSAVVAVDASAPSGSMVINGGAAHTNSTEVTLILDCVDTMSGCSQMAISTDGTTWPVFGPYARNIVIPLPSGDGVKTVWVRYSDALDHASQAYTARIDLDTTPPVSSVSPAEGVFNSARSISLSSSEPGTIYYTTDGSIPTTMSPVYLTPLMVAETTTINFFAMDRSGNIETPLKSATYTIDTQAPALTVSTLPDGASTNNTTLNIAGKITDNTAVQGVSISATPVMVNPDGTFSQVVTLATGSNLISTVATDTAGNSTTDMRTITLDQAVPIITITSPADNGITNQLLSTVTGTLDKTATVTVTVNNNPGPTVNHAQFSFPISLAYGQNTIQVTATDLAGNIGTAKRTVTLDNQTPSLSITYPAQDMTISQNQLTLTGQVSDLTPVAVTVAVDGDIFMPQAVGGNFSQTITFTIQKTYQITVTAVDEAGNQSQVQRNVIYSGIPQNLGVFGATGVTISGGYVDSYDSSQGAYNGSHGFGLSIGTNSAESGSINLSGGSIDYGNAYVGPGGNTATGIMTSGGAVIYGTRGALVIAKDMTPLSDPGGGTPATFRNGTTLTTGTYRVSSINLSGGGIGTINGNVTLYVTGNLTLSGSSRLVILPGGSLTVYLDGNLNVSGGSMVNETLSPHNLTIYGTLTCSTVTYSGSSAFYGSIYAPAAKISISGGNVYGSIIGRSVSISGGAAVHYDESLGM